MKKFLTVSLLASAAMVTACAGDDYDRAPHHPQNERVYLEREAYYDSKTGRADYYFDSIDYNGNGLISPSEHAAFAEMSFEDADLNGDGYLSRAEVRTYSRDTVEEWKPAKKTYKGRAKAGSPNVKLPNRTNANPTEHSANPTNPSQENRR